MLFLKACALGNDFVIVPDPPVEKEHLFSYWAQLIANRRYGVGCDQVIFLTDLVRFFNVDGSESSACGNGTRAVALWKMLSENLDTVTISTKSEDLFCEKISPTHVRVYFYQTPRIQVNEEGVHVDIGNPHFVYFLEDLSKNTNEIFYHKYAVNIEATKIIDASTIEVMTYERGVGPTPSCGTGACAAALAAYTKKLIKSSAQVHQPGGVLEVEIHKDSFSLTGPVQFVFSGSLLLEEA